MMASKYELIQSVFERICNEAGVLRSQSFSDLMLKALLTRFEHRPKAYLT